MTGIEKIIEKIENDCKITCDNIISKAQAEAQEITDKAKMSYEATKDDIIKASNEKSSKAIKLAQSRAENESRQAILEAKNHIIIEAVNEALEKLKNLPSEKYFDIIEKLIYNYAQKGHGVVHFSDKDTARIPPEFEAKINNSLKGEGKSVSISSDPVFIDGGFVIVYDDIEQNCAFDALLNNSNDKIKDELFKVFFTGEQI
jgi:V/A-type H+-transporting ATPase subunit E